MIFSIEKTTPPQIFVGVSMGVFQLKQLPFYHLLQERKGYNTRLSALNNLVLII